MRGENHSDETGTPSFMGGASTSMLVGWDTGAQIPQGADTGCTSGGLVLALDFRAGPAGSVDHVIPASKCVGRSDIDTRSNFSTTVRDTTSDSMEVLYESTHGCRVASSDLGYPPMILKGYWSWSLICHVSVGHPSIS